MAAACSVPVASDSSAGVCFGSASITSQEMFRNPAPAAASTVSSASCAVCIRPRRRSCASDKDCTPRESRFTPAARRRCRFSGVKVAGFASRVISASGGIEKHAAAQARICPAVPAQRGCATCQNRACPPRCCWCSAAGSGRLPRYTPPSVPVLQERSRNYSSCTCAGKTARGNIARYRSFLVGVVANRLVQRADERIKQTAQHIGRHNGTQYRCIPRPRHRQF